MDCVAIESVRSMIWSASKTMSVRILVAAHKAYPFPKEEIYTPIQVGKVNAREDLGILGDDTGVHISEKNGCYSELSALYWAWKSGFFSDVEYCGLVHYRRYFKGSVPFQGAKIMGVHEAKHLMARGDIILPKRRNYWIESVRSHYAHAHFAKDLALLDEVMRRLHPEYFQTYEAVMGGTKLYLYNMFMMRVELFDAYCSWLFPMLFELERHIDISDYDPYQRRVFGFLAERLFNVWTLRQSQLGKRIEMSAVVYLEGEPFFAKAIQMLRRKFLPIEPSEK